MMGQKRQQSNFFFFFSFSYKFGQNTDTHNTYSLFLSLSFAKTGHTIQKINLALREREGG